jgi:putative transposase
MLISIPPKYSVAEVIGYLEGKDYAECGTQGAEFSGSQILGEGFVSTVGRNEEMIRAYIRYQEMADKQLDQPQLKLSSS